MKLKEYLEQFDESLNEGIKKPSNKTMIRQKQDYLISILKKYKSYKRMPKNVKDLYDKEAKKLAEISPEDANVFFITRITDALQKDIKFKPIKE